MVFYEFAMVTIRCESFFTIKNILSLRLATFGAWRKTIRVEADEGAVEPFERRSSKKTAENMHSIVKFVLIEPSLVLSSLAAISFCLFGGATPAVVGSEDNEEIEWIATS